MVLVMPDMDMDMVLDMAMDMDMVMDTMESVRLKLSQRQRLMLLFCMVAIMVKVLVMLVMDMDMVLDMVMDMDTDMDMVMDTMANVRLKLSQRPRLILTFFMVDMVDTMAMPVTTDMLDTHMPGMVDMLTMVKQQKSNTLTENGQKSYHCFLCQ